MTTNTTSRKLPAPFYAAAGAGDVFVEQLRKIPSKVEELRDRSKVDERAAAVRSGVEERVQLVRENVLQGVETLKNLDSQKVRETANTTASTFAEKAKEARSRATETYTGLVERGERVTNGERSPIRVIATITGKNDESKTGVEAEIVVDKSGEDKSDMKPTSVKKRTNGAAPTVKKPATTATK